MAARIRSGVTLVELLVVIAIIGILVTLLLPAVQAAREAGRRIGCSNKLKQMGLALHHYHDVHQVFPPGSLFYVSGSSYDLDKGRLSYLVHILPFMERGDVFNRVNFHAPWLPESTAHLADIVLQDVLCPSFRNPSSFVSSGAAIDYYCIGSASTLPE